jgi:hypothetical protein
MPRYGKLIKTALSGLGGPSMNNEGHDRNFLVREKSRDEKFKKLGGKEMLRATRVTW